VLPGRCVFHLCRGDFYLEHKKAHALKKKHSAYLSYSPIVDVARMLAKQLRQAQMRVLYVATDASNTELQLFKSILRGVYRCVCISACVCTGVCVLACVCVCVCVIFLLIRAHPPSSSAPHCLQGSMWRLPVGSRH